MWPAFTVYELLEVPIIRHGLEALLEADHHWLLSRTDKNGK